MLRVLFAFLLGVAGCTGARAVSTSLPTDRARLRVTEIADAENPSGPRLKVLRTDANTPLRAGTAWLWSEPPTEPPDSYYADLRKAGFNAVRLILFDVWIHEEGYRKYDWDAPDYRRAMLTRIEHAVNLCSKNGLYAVINAHNRVPGAAPKYDEKLNTGLWRAVAPFFANRAHVIYELANEPLAGPGHDGALEPAATRTLEALVRVHATARALAPSTHLMILSPAGVSGWGTPTAMGNLTRNFKKIAGPIDWTKTSVAYHLYHADADLFPRAENLRALHREFPGWPSENNFPAGYSAEKLGLKAGDSERSVSFGSDEFILQTCERLGLGWSQWQINGPEQFRRNWPLLRADAEAKGYAWKPDLARSPRPSP